MKIHFLISACCLCFVFGGLFSTSSGCTSHKQSTEAKGSATLYICPMHPHVHSDKPGKCSICGMDLVLQTPADGKKATLSDSADKDHATIELSPSRQTLIGVKTGKVEKRPLFRQIHAPGRVAFDPELYTAQAEYQEALSQLERVKDSPLMDARHSAQRMVESSKLRLKLLGLSDLQITALQSGKVDSSSLLLQKPGEDVWVYAEVFEMDLPLVKPGLEVELSAGFLQGKTLFGKVASVDRVLNTTTRTAKVRIHLPKAKQILRPEAYVDASILVPLGDQLTVPIDAIMDTGKRAIVFVAQANHHFEPREVRLRFTTSDWAAIESGLAEGESIVTSGNFLIDSESRLQFTLNTAVTQND